MKIRAPDNDNRSAPDLQFSNLGAFAGVQPMTDAGEDWLSDNLGQDAMEYGGWILIDFRCIEDVMLGARAEGLICHG